MLGSIAVYHLMVFFMTSVTGNPIKAQALSHWIMAKIYKFVLPYLTSVVNYRLKGNDSK